ncbi:hypothetical protein lbkm_3728 [Lachnospiraceae bacterium KM106-2]|nr:hypothetical protein lbkm_3728 [Lachnospiraceae bacterium KM106-2]
MKRKKGYLLAVFAILVLVVAGCSKGKKTVSFDVKNLAKEILDQGKFSDDMMLLDSDVYDAQFPDIDTTKVAKGAIYVSSGAATDEIIVLEAKSENDAKALEDAVMSSIEYQIDSNKDYLPKQVKKLQNPIKVVSGKYVIVCVTDDKDKVNQLLKKKDIIS